MTSKLDKLNLSTDEVDRFKKAMEDPKFRDLLKEYTDEISDPKNRAEHEAYLREVEERAKGDAAAQSGDYSNVAGAMNIPLGSRLVSPTPVFCIKLVVPPNAPRKVKPATPVTVSRKVFINLCTCDAMDDISSQKVGAGQSTPQAGQQFSLPYSLSAPRDCKDVRGDTATVYDFVFSEATWLQYRAHMRVVSMFQDMAVEAVEEKEGLENGAVHKADVVILKNTTFKGGKPPPRLFKVSEEKQKSAKQTPPPPQQQQQKTPEAKPTTSPADLRVVSTKSTTAASTDAAPATPKVDPRAAPTYTLTHRGYFDLTAGQMTLSSEQTGHLADLTRDRPKELVLKISLPLVAKIADVNLDQSPHQILLTSEQYFLLLPLPYPVVEEHGKASWSGKTKTLTVTMVVGPPSEEEVAKYHRQRAGYDAHLQQKQADQEAQKREEERKEAEAAAAAAAAAQQEREALERKAAEEEKQRRIDQSASAPSITLKSRTPSPSSAGSATSPLISALKSASSSPHLGPAAADRHVRFSFSEPQVCLGIPERDGPLGPKPVGKLIAEEEIPVPKKGHKKKHVPGAEGPEAWTGVGREPNKEIMALIPDSTATGTGSTAPKGKKGPNSAPLWPSYTYSQSHVGVVLVIKIKSVVADSVNLAMADLPAEDDAAAARTVVDLSFATSSPRKLYRLYLPLAYAINTTKSSFDCTSKNLILNLVKMPPSGDAAAAEWDHLLDYSHLGEFDAEGTPLSSPSASPLVRHQAAVTSQMDDLSLDDAHTPAQSTSELVQPVDDATDAEQPIVPSEPVTVVTMQPIDLTAASTMLNPFIAQATSAATTGRPTAAASSSLLYQLD